MAVITVSRELGSSGAKVIDLLCDKLGYCRVDKAVLSQIAQEAGIDVKAVLAHERDVTRKPKLISNQMTSLYGRQPTAFGKKGNIEDQVYSRIVRETLTKYAQEGNATIVGRGGQIILQDWPTALHVHLYAPKAARIQELVTRYKVSRLDAERRIERSDEQKRMYIRNLHKNADWKDLKYYHLAIDTSRVSTETAAEIIMLAVAELDSA
jgi:cytidylate kinase